MTDHDMPEGIQILGQHGELYKLDDLEQRPDENGLRVWLVRIPDDLPIRFPPELKVARLPERTQLEVEFVRPDADAT